MLLTDDEYQSVTARQLWPEGAWPCCSPDGKQVVFTGHLGSRNSCLMLLSLDEVGAEPQVITPLDINARRPAWLAQGRQIAFNNGQRSIWTLDLETGLLAPFLPDLGPNGRAYLHPCAYPAERAVVVVSQYQTKKGRAAVLYKLAPAADNPVSQLTTFPEVCAGRPGISPDGKQVIFAGNSGRFNQGANQLWLVGLNGVLQRLEQGDDHLIQGRAPRWSPDGQWIACTSTRPKPTPDEQTPRAVWIISVDGKQAYRLTDHTLNPLHVVWTPDQQQIICGGDSCALTILTLPEPFHRRLPTNVNQCRPGQ